MKAQFAKFPEHKQKGGNNSNNTTYIKKYRNMRIDSRDIKVALEASDNKRNWWIYTYLMAYPFRLEHTKQT